MCTRREVVPVDVEKQDNTHLLAVRTADNLVSERVIKQYALSLAPEVAIVLYLWGRWILSAYRTERERKLERVRDTQRDRDRETQREIKREEEGAGVLTWMKGGLMMGTWRARW